MILIPEFKNKDEFEKYRNEEINIHRELWKKWEIVLNLENDKTTDTFSNDMYDIYFTFCMRGYIRKIVDKKNKDAIVITLFSCKDINEMQRRESDSMSYYKYHIEYKKKKAVRG